MATVKLTFGDIEVAIEDDDISFEHVAPQAETILYRVVEKVRNLLNEEE